MALLGNNLIVFDGDTPIGLAKSCEINIRCDLQEVSAPNLTSSGQFRRYVATRKDWSVTCSFLLQTFKDRVLKVGESVTLTFGSRDDETDRLTGTAICTQARITATRGNLCQGSWEFRGNSPLTSPSTT